MVEQGLAYIDWEYDFDPCSGIKKLEITSQTLVDEHIHFGVISSYRL